MSKRVEHMFEIAKKTAIKNLDAKNNHHLGAVLCRGGSVISTGANVPKRNSLIRFIAEQTNSKPINIHAEVSALLGVPTAKSSGGTIYVVRIKQHDDGSVEYKLAKPCKHCQEFMKKRRIKKAYYSISGMDKTKEWGVLKL